MKIRPHHAPSSALARDDPATLPCPGTCGSGTRSCRPSSALLRTYLLLTTFVLPLTFACQDDRSADADGDTISDPQGCRSIRLLAESDAESESETTATTATATDSATDTTTTTTATTSATDSDTSAAGGPVCGNGVLEDGEQCDDGNSDNTDACTNACEDASCGDGVLQPPEQCDDGNNGDDLDGCTDECTLRYTVFVTSKTWPGDLGREPGDLPPGLDLADLRCQTLADNAGLSGKFRAWLSDSTGSPSTRFETAPKGMDDSGFTGAFTLHDGTEVAVGWEGLTTADDANNLLLHAIDMDEAGAVQTNRGVWSNTTFSGVKKDANPDFYCFGWTSRDPEDYGRRGSTSFSDMQWTDFGGPQPGCSAPHHLYCFQVALP